MKLPVHADKRRLRFDEHGPLTRYLLDKHDRGRTYPRHRGRNDQNILIVRRRFIPDVDMPHDKEDPPAGGSAERIIAVGKKFGAGLFKMLEIVRVINDRRNRYRDNRSFSDRYVLS